MAILKSAKKAEGDLLKIAGVGVLGGIAIYALIKSAPAIGDLFNKTIGSITSGIQAGFPTFTSGGSSSSGGQTVSGVPLPGTVDTKLGGSTGITPSNVHEAIKQAGLSPAPSYADKFIAAGAVAEQNSPGVLDQAIKILTGQLSSPNLATHPDLKAAENSLVVQLSQSAASELVDQNVVGLYQIHGKGSVLPLTQNAVDYDNQHHIDITEITHY